MKKMFIGLMITLLYFSNIALAEGLEAVKEIDVYFLENAEMDTYLAKNTEALNGNLVNEDVYTKFFTSGNTRIQLTLPMIVGEFQNSNISNYFNDEYIMQLVESQTQNMTLEEKTIKQGELIEIINQIRNCYRKLNFLNVENTVIPCYALNLSSLYETEDTTITNLDVLNGNLVFGINQDNVSILLNVADLSELPDSVTSDSLTNDSAGGATGGSSGGGSSNNSNTTNTQQNQPTVVQKVYEDLNKYQGEHEFAAEDVRSAEFSVIAHCWECGKGYNNIITEDTTDVKLATSKKTYTFTYHPNYAQDTVMEFDDALALLTDYNFEKFKEKFKEEVIDQIWIEMTDSRGNRVVNPTATNEARKKEWDKLEDIKEVIRSRYTKIDVIVAEGVIRQFYVRDDFMKDIKNTVFSQDEGEKLIAIKTDQYNDVFTQETIARGGGIVKPSIAIGKMQYLLNDPNGENFYLCDACSKCKKGCSKYVAFGDDANETGIGIYFSKYCEDHACKFVWEYLADSGNVGDQYEGLQCKDAWTTEKKLCDTHTCDSCSAAIVGVSAVDARAKVTSRKTGSASLDDYSKYCNLHKCMAKNCKEARLNSDDTVDSDNSQQLALNAYCSKHNNGCNVYVPSKGDSCGNPVTATEDGKVSAMICDMHLNSVRQGEVDYIKEIYGDAALATRFVNPNAETIIFFAGDGEKASIDKTTAYIGNINNLSDKNIICIAIPENGGSLDATVWEQPTKSLVEYLNEAAKSGQIDSSNIQIAGFSSGGYGATYLAGQLVQSSSNSIKYDVDLTIVDGAVNNKVTTGVVQGLLNQGVNVSIYASDEGGGIGGRTQQLYNDLKGQVTGGVIKGTGHGQEFVEKAMNDRLANY